ncbi:MAG: LamG domain-containing protein [Myxococcota bacterium]|nr:LamG domain-containing protein [Myxococcota bacterium]
MKYLIAALLAGCGFSAAPGASEPDEGMDASSASEPDDGPTVRRRCEDPSTRLCVDFEETAAVSDERGSPIEAFAIEPERRLAEQAGSFSVTSQLLVGEGAALDITPRITIEMWARPDAIPEDASWLLDNPTQYSIQLDRDGNVQCTMAGERVISSRALTAATWHHVACTYDGQLLRVYIDGSLRGCRGSNRPIAIDGTLGTAIGARLQAVPAFANRFLGDLDDVHLYARALSASEICALGATGPACTSSCFSDGGSGGDG